MKTLETLIDDISGLHVNGHQPSEESLIKLGNEIAQLVGKSLARNLSTGEDRVTLRMSNIGKPARQLWYESRAPKREADLDGTTLRKFLMGDIWESLLLWLAEEAGHKVEAQQQEVEVNGIKGHIDAVVDDVVVDVKSASRFAFEKFRKETLIEDDSFGYYEQLGGYAEALDKEAAWFAVNKDTAELKLLKLESEEIKALQITERIDHLREALASDELPSKCHDPQPDGTAGNMVLHKDCSYCPFKLDCWSDANEGQGLRIFEYANRPKYFTHVAKEPRVFEQFPLRGN